ncbi:microfibril-associated glycoprotein 4-like [Acanthaster planci]|uniref:Microfibril-associated glycoprotein 4-like n=1 Tax=Acanthaster planci TaxID=133434 RepID=A0A8B7YT94_ACAPL|nr:microfibril-associated glycoprotein 4-like [Acanthaster planci]
MMKFCMLLLLACCVVGIRAENGNKHQSTEPSNPEAVQSAVTSEVLKLIEVAIKVAQYTDSAEKQKAVGWVQERLSNIKDLLDSTNKQPTEPETVYYEDCSALLSEGFSESGLYDIYPAYPESTDPMQVYCDQETDGGGWIVFQRRVDGSESFERTWDEYRQGFGNLEGEFWLGNDNLVLLTVPGQVSGGSGGNVELRVDIRDWADNTAFAKYLDFSVQGSEFTLTADNFAEESTAGDALDYHNGMDFTTIDHDNDRASGGNCANWMRGGFWFNYCLTADPNGPYLPEEGEHGALSPGTDQGVTWTTYTGHGYPGREYSLKGTEMKLRRAPVILS